MLRSMLVAAAVMSVTGGGPARAVCVGMALGASTDYNGPSSAADYATNVTRGASGEMVVVGSRSGPTGLDNWLIRRYDPTLGTILSATTYNSPGNSYDSPNDVAVDGSGNIIVVGFESRGDLSQSDNLSIRKYDPMLSTLIGATTFNNPSNSDENANAVAVDGSGNIIVVGYVNRTDLTQNYNWLVNKYDPTLTTLLSTTMYNSPANNTDFANAVEVDGSGNIFVAGYEVRNDLGEGNNWRIIKYNPTLTTILSTTAYHGLGNSDDQASGMAFGPTGNVVVCGYETRPDLGQGQNWRINEYNPSLTTILSTTDFNGPSNLSEYPWNVAVDPAGHVVVAGYESTSGAGNNWRMCVWSLGFASLMTSTDYDGPAGTDDYGYGVALDGSGNVVVVGYEAGITGGDNWRLRRYVCPESGGGGAAAPPTGPRADAGALFAYPNPVTGDTVTLALGLGSDATEVVVTFFNIGMAKVYGETFASVPASPGRVKLEGLLKVAPGVYLVRVTARLADGTAKTFPTRKLVVKR